MAGAGAPCRMGRSKTRPKASEDLEISPAPELPYGPSGCPLGLPKPFPETHEMPENWP